MTERKHGTPGTLVPGQTHRYEDTIPEMMLELERLDPRAATALTSEYSGLGWPYSMAGLAFGDPFDEVQDEWAPHLFGELMDALNECAPPGHFFGTHPHGDCLGFWRDEDD